MRKLAAAAKTFPVDPCPAIATSVGFSSAHAGGGADVQRCEIPLAENLLVMPLVPGNHVRQCARGVFAAWGASATHELVIARAVEERDRGGADRPELGDETRERAFVEARVLDERVLVECGEHGLVATREADARYVMIRSVSVT